MGINLSVKQQKVYQTFFSGCEDVYDFRIDFTTPEQIWKWFV